MTDVGDEVVTRLSDVDPVRVADGQPVRDFPVYVGRRNYSGYFWSATMGQHVVYESLLELSWLWLADFDPRVRKIAAQPMHWLGRDDGRIRTRIPDFLCLLSDDSVHIVDVKMPEAAAEPDAIASLGWPIGPMRPSRSGSTANAHLPHNRLSHSRPPPVLRPASTTRGKPAVARTPDSPPGA